MWQERIVGTHRQAGVPLLLLLFLQLPLLLSLPPVWLQGPVPAVPLGHVVPQMGPDMHIIWPDHLLGIHVAAMLFGPSLCVHSVYLLSWVCSIVPLDFTDNTQVYGWKLGRISRQQEQSIRPMQEPWLAYTVYTSCCWLCLYGWNLCDVCVILCPNVLKTLNFNPETVRRPGPQKTRISYSNFSI